MIYTDKNQRGCRSIQKNEASKILDKTPCWRKREKQLVNAEDESCTPMMGIPTEQWDDLPPPVLMFFQTSSQEVFQMEPITDESK